MQLLGRTTLRAVTVGIALIAGAASAEPRLLSIADAPVLAHALATPLNNGMNMNMAATEMGRDEGISFHAHLGVGFLAGLAGSLAGTYIGVGLGSLSNTLIGAVIPVLLSNLFIAPFITVLTAWLVGNAISPGRYKFWLPWTAAFVLHAACYIAASFLGVAWLESVGMLVYTAIDALVMSVGSVGLMHLLDRRPEVTTIRSFVPNVSDTKLLSFSKVTF